MNPFMSGLYRGMGAVFSSVMGEIGVLHLETGDDVRLHVIYRPGREIIDVRDDVQRTWEDPSISFRRDQLAAAGVTLSLLETATVTLESSGETYGLDNVRDDETSMVRCTATTV